MRWNYNVRHSNESEESKLHRLERESSEWYAKNGHTGILLSECDDYLSEHNRQVKIQKLREDLGYNRPTEPDIDYSH